jgi:hypothetical protein
MCLSSRCGCHPIIQEPKQYAGPWICEMQCRALLACGHPEGLHVTLLDPEVISPTNCVRQPFSQSEIGLYKSVVLANRLNLFWGWTGKEFPNVSTANGR